MHNIPIIRFEIEGMKHTLYRALTEHAAVMDAQVKQAVEDFCRPENIDRVIGTAAARALQSAIEDEVQSFFRYGPGRKVVAEAVRAKLLSSDDLPA